MTEDEAESIEDLYAIARAKGFKPGWAYMAAKRKGGCRNGRYFG
ncbi:Uncharacterised protein [Enterococcus durans]|uniref:Uncharacterized protein n=1 Tax=Enterococcus durans TaxID=53345 RepID=A0A377MSM1_9ENTE|nr:Uncharacterised protein [Enterococcus durans]